MAHNLLMCLRSLGALCRPLPRERGIGSCPFDLNVGKDLSQLEMRIEVCRVIEQRRPKILVTSPPCTMYSKLKRLWNVKEMSPEEYTRRKAIADEHLWFAHTCNKIQHNAGRSFAHEHPAGASSWKEDLDTGGGHPPGDVHCSLRPMPIWLDLAAWDPAQEADPDLVQQCAAIPCPPWLQVSSWFAHAQAHPGERGRAPALDLE